MCLIDVPEHVQDVHNPIVSPFSGSSNPPDEPLKPLSTSSLVKPFVSPNMTPLVGVRSSVSFCASLDNENGSSHQNVALNGVVLLPCETPNCTASNPVASTEVSLLGDGTMNSVVVLNGHFQAEPTHLSSEVSEPVVLYSSSYNSSKVIQCEMSPIPSVHDFSSFTNTIEYDEVRKVFENSYDGNFEFFGFESEGTTITEGGEMTSPKVSIEGIQGRSNIEMTPCINDVSTPDLSLSGSINGFLFSKNTDALEIMSHSGICDCMHDSLDFYPTPCIMYEVIDAATNGVPEMEDRNSITEPISDNTSITQSEIVISQGASVIPFLGKNTWF